MLEGKTIRIIIPTYNGGYRFAQLTKSLVAQAGVMPEDVLIIDSGSTDTTLQQAENAGFRIHHIDKHDFGYGKTRHWAVENEQADYIIFMTQDAILADTDAIMKLCQPLKDNSRIGLSYGRQLPYTTVKDLEDCGRLFNYPAKSCMKSKDDIARFGIKTIFCSDSFAVYNRQNLLSVGNFLDVEFGEDTLAADAFIENGYYIYYNAEARVHHSHSFSLYEEFSRGVRIGMLHREHAEVFSKYKGVNSEGIKFVKFVVQTLYSNGRKMAIPLVAVHILLKFIGYHAGKRGWI